MPNPAMLSTQRGQILRDEPAAPATQTDIRQAEGVTQKGSSTG